MTKTNTFDRDILFQKLLGMGIGLGIMISLYIYESRNLKQIAALIGERENTTLHQVKKLLSDDFIEIDPIASATARGKYYQLTEKGKEALDCIKDTGRQDIEDFELKLNMNNIHEKMLESITKANFNNSLEQIHFLTKINQYIENISVNNLLNITKIVNTIGTKEKQLEFLKNNNLPFGEFSFGMKTVKIYNFGQYEEILRTMVSFYKKIENLRNKFEKTDNKEFESTQYFYLFAAPLFRDIIEN